MRDYADKYYLHARFCAMRGRLLSLPDYVSLAGNPDEAWPDQTNRFSDPIEAEETIFREQVTQIMHLSDATRTYTPLFLAFFRQFEALNAKVILAKAFGLKPLEQWYDITPHAVLDRGLLEGTDILQDIRPLLKGTYLADLLEDLSDYDHAELLVDLCVLKGLYKASEAFAPREKRDFRCFIGKRMAVTLTLMSLRLEKNYQWDPEKIRPYLEPFHHIFEGKIRPHVKVVEKTLAGHLERLQTTENRWPDLVYVEHYLEQYFYDWTASVFRRDFQSIWCVAAYLWLLYYQIRNLYRIMQGKRFGFSPERILGGIVCTA